MIGDNSGMLEFLDTRAFSATDLLTLAANFPFVRRSDTIHNSRN